MARTQTVEEFATALQQALGSRLVAFLLYGSAARGSGAHVPGRSDWNTLLIVDRMDDGLFAAIAPAVSAWTQGGHPAPILLSDAEWRASADVFAIEYEDMREAHRLLAGRDPWPGVTVQRADVRRQLEQELMVKLVRLRQAYAALRNDPKRLAAVVGGSVAGVLTMLRTTLRLAGRKPPAAPEALVREAAALLELSPDPLVDLVGQSRGGGGGRALQLATGDPRAAAYLAAVARVAEFVNRLT